MALSYYDFQAQNERLNRKQKMAEAMGQSAIEPFNQEMAGQLVVGRGWGEGLTKLGQAYLAQRGIDSAWDQRKELSTQRDSDVTSAMTAYTQAVAGGMPKQQAAAQLLSGISNPEDIARLVATQAFTPEKYGSPTKTASGQYAQFPESGGPPIWTGAMALPEKPQVVTVGSGGDKQTAVLDPRDPTKFNPLGTPYKSGQQISVGNTFPPQEREYDKAIGKQFAGQYVTIQKAANTSARRLNNYQQLDSLLEGVYTGTGGTAVLAAKKLGSMLGMDTAGIGNAEAARALANEAALQLRDPSGGAGMPGAMSDQDRAFLQSMVPGLETTPEGRKQMVFVAQQIAKRDLEVAQVSREYSNANGGRIDEGLYEVLAQKFGGTNMFSGAPLIPDAVDPASTPPTLHEIDAEIARRQGGQ